MNGGFWDRLRDDLITLKGQLGSRPALELYRQAEYGQFLAAPKQWIVVCLHHQPPQADGEPITMTFFKTVVGHLLTALLTFALVVLWLGSRPSAPPQPPRQVERPSPAPSKTVPNNHETLPEPRNQPYVPPRNPAPLTPGRPRQPHQPRRGNQHPGLRGDQSRRGEHRHLGHRPRPLPGRRGQRFRIRFRDRPGRPHPDQFPRRRGGGRPPGRSLRRLNPRRQGHRHRPAQRRGHDPCRRPRRQALPGPPGR